MRWDLFGIIFGDWHMVGVVESNIIIHLWLGLVWYLKFSINALSLIGRIFMSDWSLILVFGIVRWCVCSFKKGLFGCVVGLFCPGVGIEVVGGSEVKAVC